MENLIGSLDQCLPPAYDWLSKLVVEAADGLAKDAWNVIPVAKEKDKLSLLAKDASSIESKVQEQIKALAWQVSDKPQRVVIDGIPLLLVAKPKIKTNPLQVSRQLGFDVAASLVKAENKNIVVGAMDGDLTVEDIFEGICLGFDDRAAFKSKRNSLFPTSMKVVKASLTAAKDRVEVARSLVFAKWLQDAPANFLNSEQFADIAVKHFGDKAKVTVLGRKEMAEKGMGSFLSVAKGSIKDPKLVTIEIAGKDSSKSVALVGKGVTFDTGGINLKPSPGLEDMKYDMSGAAAVYGAAHYLCEVQPPVNVVCAIGAVENMPSGDATRPGDIVKSLSGKTIEILNTDAEGRLVLADVLTHVIDSHKPNLVIDIATLTGAVLFGLGHAGAAYMTPEDKTSDLLNHVGKTFGEALWRLPLWPELEGEVQSELADIKNLPKPNVKAGTIMGGWFLHEFVKDANCQWAHVDIAGTAWNCSATGYHKAGGSAYGVRTLVGACMSFEA
ncbi:leucyl aminopeptidase family protein [Pseudobacteriovorax antillogorgiicola]|uniref:Leucyl aminopeptidase n=1 Tax=Pseudobacteriovorax antillogorgiicola TaxID=1513793 RepID=A0A1Y6BP57_9BACT|nr:leucyl aminopeptidase family protein [Pseudobacteriovorax antillogorgiicola]TCS55352.1 leucyl aminopeptidase [Pseudobacteriovorax antillogorgiicola]SMF13753.1 Leucyl aminopeptidase [Pseudobacteriovorax antillogorgiicola]